MPSTPVPVPLASPCRVCGGPLTYSGRGRRPIVCSPECRSARRADDQRARRAESADSAIVAAPVAIAPDGDAELLALAERLASLAPARVDTRERSALRTGADLRAERRASGEDAQDLPFTAEGGWSSAARPRSADPAARWLAEHHPEALADFGPDV